MHALLDAHADRSKSCIDFGCGVGKYLPELSPRFKSVVGVDISQALLDKAMENTVWSGNGRSRQRKLKNVKLLSVVVLLGGFFGAATPFALERVGSNRTPRAHPEGVVRRTGGSTPAAAQLAGFGRLTLRSAGGTTDGGASTPPN